MSETPAAANASLPPPEQPPQTPVGRPARGWLWLLFFIVAAGAGYYHYDRYKAKVAAEAERKAAEEKKGKGRGAGTPVVAAPVRKGNLNVHIYALGTVTPLRTVTVRSR